MLLKVKALYSQIIKFYLVNPTIFAILFLLGNLNLLIRPLIPSHFSILFSLLTIGWVGFKFELLKNFWMDEKIEQPKDLIKKYFYYWKLFVPFYLIFIVLITIFSFISIFFATYKVLDNFTTYKNTLFGVWGLVYQFFKNPFLIENSYLKYTFLSELISLSLLVSFFIFSIIIQFFVLTKPKRLKTTIKQSFIFIKNNFHLLLVFFIIDRLISSIISTPTSLIYLARSNGDLNTGLTLISVTTIPIRVWHIISYSTLFLIVSNYFRDNKNPT